MTVADQPPRPARLKGNLWRVALLVFLIAVVIAMSFVFPIKQYLIKFLDYTRSLGLTGMAMVVGLYVIACIFALPGSVLTIGTGVIFGVFAGTITVSVGSTLGACAAFIIGRTIGRQWVQQKAAAKPKFAAIDKAIGTEGFKIVFLTRLSPIFPFNFQNYAYGLTKVSLGKYALASWIGMLPGTVMYVYIGSAVGSLADLAEGEVQSGPAQRVLFWMGLAATVIVVVLVTRIARSAIRKNIPQQEPLEQSDQ